MLKKLSELLKKHTFSKAMISSRQNNTAVSIEMEREGIQIYHVEDERSAAYFAIGQYEESEKKIALICTDNLALRNYSPGLTEAYYRKIPLIVILLTQEHSYTINNKRYPKDLFIFEDSIHITSSHNISQKLIDRIDYCISRCESKGGGPVLLSIKAHDILNINLEQYKIKENTIVRLKEGAPSLNITAKHVAFYFAPSRIYPDGIIKEIHNLAQKKNISIYSAINSGYYNTDRFLLKENENIELAIDLVICFGSSKKIPFLKANEIWYVTENTNYAEIYGLVDYIFESTVAQFLNYFYNLTVDLEFKGIPYPVITRSCKSLFPHDVFNRDNSANVIHIDHILLDIFYNDIAKLQAKVVTDIFGWNGGILSSTIGASIIDPNTNHICISSASSILYDLNSLGNRHVSTNLCIMIIPDSNIVISTIKTFAQSWYYQYFEINNIEDINNEIYSIIFSREKTIPPIIVLNFLKKC